MYDTSWASEGQHDHKTAKQGEGSAEQAGGVWIKTTGSQGHTLHYPCDIGILKRQDSKCRKPRVLIKRTYLSVWNSGTGRSILWEAWIWAVPGHSWGRGCISRGCSWQEASSWNFPGPDQVRSLVAVLTTALSVSSLQLILSDNSLAWPGESSGICDISWAPEGQRDHRSAEQGEGPAADKQLEWE